MATDIDTQDSEDQNDEKPYVRMKREDIRALEESAARAKEADSLKRELAFAKAGLDTESKLGKMFFNSYEGDLTKEALLAEAQEIGLVEKSTTNPEIPQDERESTKERQTLNNGATPPGDNPVHPKEEAKANAKRVIDEGGKYEQAAGAYVSTLVQRHAAGDTRATRNPNERFK